jgi:putative phosphoesterase
MKIIVMSDSHGNRSTIETIRSKNADAYFHCGDSELSFDELLLQGVYCVRGNCDVDHRFPLEQYITLGDLNVLVQHGHLHDVNQSLLSLDYLAKEKNAQIVLFGHTHLYGADIKDDILFVNPGSTKQPRGGKSPTYALIQWEDTLSVNFKNMDHETVLFKEFALNKKLH